MLKLIFLFLLSVLSFAVNFLNSGYDFSKPVLQVILPGSLHEISGLTIVDNTTIACIQDENGIVFFYDIEQRKIKNQFIFGANGDYEGITLVDKTLYILRSDGAIFEINDFQSPQPSVKTYTPQVPSENNEGLCYDPESNRLLIGAKGKINKDPEYKDHRFIYAFNLKLKKLEPKPVFIFNVSDINITSKLNGTKMPTRTNKKGVVFETGFKLNTSEIAIHPSSKQLYVLSASDHCLFIFNMNGKLEETKQLDPNMFNKPEGLSFFSNADLIISNEGQTRVPTLLRFNYQR
ncbi:MAG: hypothetical protein K0R26_105 [Bacteroidota bacterium]|jgi:hypothetical protein|nr:hypothetical protein [Bacteroidota bacterium]